MPPAPHTHMCGGNRQSQSREGFRRKAEAGFLDLCSTPARPAGILTGGTDNCREKLEMDSFQKLSSHFSFIQRRRGSYRVRNRAWGRRAGAKRRQAEPPGHEEGETGTVKLRQTRTGEELGRRTEKRGPRGGPRRRGRGVRAGVWGLTQGLGGRTWVFLPGRRVCRPDGREAPPGASLPSHPSKGHRSVTENHRQSARSGAGGGQKQQPLHTVTCVCFAWCRSSGPFPARDN